MLRHTSEYRDRIVVPLGALTGAALLCLSAFGQDGQRAATAKVVRDRVTAEAVEKTVPAAKGAADDETKTGARPEGLKRRGGEKTSDGTRGRSVVLGMNLQETNNGQVKVVDVGAASPAFEAGIRKGDELVSFGDFKADTYRKWIDGMRRVTTESLDGSMISVAVMRNHQVIKTKVRVPEGRGAVVQLPIGPGAAGGDGVPPQSGPQQGEQGIVGAPAGGDNNIAIENSGPFGAFFSDQANPASERAMAQLFRIGGAPKTASDAANASSTPETAGTTDTGARIGVAGFRNDQNGMLVMVDVGGLEPGNYIVGLSDPSVIGGSAATGTPTSPKAGKPEVDLKNSQTLAAPAETGTSLPAGGQARPLPSPAAEQVSTNASDPSANPTVAPLPTEIGPLTVDQSGTGRMQHVVEAAQVRNVIGQAIVIYSQASGPQKTLPPNLDPTADPTAGSTSKAGGDVGGAAAATANTTKLTRGTSTPVAGGVIRLISDRRPPTDTSGTTSEAALDDAFSPPAPVQPASNAPAVPPQAVR